MSMFVGNTFTEVKDVQGMYSKVNTYKIEDWNYKDEQWTLDESLEEDVVFESDFDDTIRSIYSDINNIIDTLEKHYDLSSAIDELKILKEKLY